MSLKYNNLSAGYLGCSALNATLNSQYYSLLEKSPDIFNSILVFPQRIPKKGFFLELYELETPDYRKRFDETTSRFIKNHTKSLENLTELNSDTHARVYINWSNVLLRYGCFEHLVNNYPKNYSGEYSLEISLLRETAKIEILLSEDAKTSIDELLELADIYLDSDKTSVREKMMLLNQIVVNYYRHQKASADKKRIFDLCNVFLELTQQFENRSFLNTLYCSVAYRALAMVNEFDAETRLSFLNNAEKLARKISWKTEIEKIVADDNLFTCLQSISKWHHSNHDILNAELYLRELIIIDPYDSTGYSELGFFYVEVESYEKAAEYFMQAMKLGPPATGMNTYYYAKCLEKLGKNKDTITYLYKSTELDRQGISAWLDLIDHFINQKNHRKVCEIANHIYYSPILFEQLEDEEKLNLQTFIS